MEWNVPSPTGLVLQRSLKAFFVISVSAHNILLRKWKWHNWKLFKTSLYIHLPLHHCLTTLTNLALRDFVPTKGNFVCPFLYHFLYRVLRHHLGYWLRPGTVWSQLVLLCSEREQVIIFCTSECSISLNHFTKAHLSVTFRSLVFIRCKTHWKWNTKKKHTDLVKLQTSESYFLTTWPPPLCIPLEKLTRDKDHQDQ